ncbi:hypothetical protein KKH07_01705 [Patescibacteria group bacterium]|nr:hypothetical protein [Patescibacteria group bacterium]MBU1563476.1 hypothetical protein [Patescibacteria group bacterium]MBU2067996.1 hypothetical protein [Patescibacteria group bacterium]
MGSLTSVQKSIIIGSILGDGSLRKAQGRLNSLLEVNHSFSSKMYVDWKYQHLKDLVITPPKKRKSNGKRIAYRFTTRSLPEITQFYEKFYQNGKKIIFKNIVLDPLIMAVWFMDDGNKTYNALYLNTQQFDLDSQYELINQLFNQWGIEATLNKDKIYRRVRIRTSSTPKFKKIIKPFVLPMFYYKLM